jgi:RHS repeat-associated protein
LGSTVDTITGASATLRTYDPFGAVRNGNMVARKNGTLNLADTIHGFTGHTHADDVGLIHMKGRVYDPNVGRFLSVDPVVDTTKSQGLNPYSYLANNPLSGTDPTGYQACTGSHVDRGAGSNCSDQGVATTYVNASVAQTPGALATKLSNVAVSHWNARVNGAVAGGGIKGAGGQTASNVASTDAGRTANNTVASDSSNAMSGDAQLLSTITVTPTMEERADAQVSGDAERMALAPVAFAIGAATGTDPWHRNPPGDDSIQQAALPGAWGLGIKGAATTFAVLRGARDVELGYETLSDLPPEAMRFLSSGRETQVYLGYRDGQAVYCGISCNVAQRQIQHGSKYQLDPITQSLTRGQSRAIEQAMILRNPQFENIRNSISPSHEYYDDVVRWGENWLQANGH